MKKPLRPLTFSKLPNNPKSQYNIRKVTEMNFITPQNESTVPS
jgi:hypothetical protein